MSKGWRWLVALFAVATTIITSGCSSSSSPPISVSLSPSAPQAIDQSQTLGVRATVTNDASSKGVSWRLTGPGSLSNSTGSSVTYNSPSTSLTNPQQATVTATSIADQTKRASLNITVNPYPQIPYQTIAGGSVGTPYSQAIALTGGTAPFQWSVYDGPIETGWRVGGSVPDGLALDPHTGTISGTPTGGGTWYFEGTVTDAAGVTVVNGFLSIQITSTVPPGNPIPVLNQPLVPAVVFPGTNDFTLNVSGTGFVSGTTIDFNGAALATTFIDSDHLSGIVPAADIATPGTASVTVVNPAPGGGRSNAVYFQVGVPDVAVNFVNAPNSPLQIYGPSALAASDFNEDGKTDLAISGSYQVYVMLGNGNGTFVAASGSPMRVPSPPYDDFPSPLLGPGLALGDFNHSGHTGLAVGLLNNLAAAIFLGNGDGTFNYSSTLAYTNGEPTMSLTAADFNADGNWDLVAANNLSGVSPVVLLGYSHGAFNAVEQKNIEISGISSATGDFNGDGKLDLVINGASILLGNGDGTFKQGSSLNTAGLVAVGDFNGDGKLDLAVCDPAKNNVTILLGNGNGTFVTAFGSPITVGTEPEAIVTGDFTNDGKLDLAIANFGDGTVTLLLGNGDGTFLQTSGSPYAAGKGPIAIAAADLNADGKLDLAVANLMDGTVSILLQP